MVKIVLLVTQNKKFPKNVIYVEFQYEIVKLPLFTVIDAMNNVTSTCT